jgi:hypothetical protein
VTISGIIKMRLQQYKISNASAARCRHNTSQGLIHDDSSRIIFNITEDWAAASGDRPDRLARCDGTR